MNKISTIKDVKEPRWSVRTGTGRRLLCGEGRHGFLGRGGLPRIFCGLEYAELY